MLLSSEDYSPGIASCGPVIALGLARCFGNTLLPAINNIDVNNGKADALFAKLREQICSELETNSRGLLGFCHPAVAKDSQIHSPTVISSSCTTNQQLVLALVGL